MLFAIQFMSIIVVVLTYVAIERKVNQPKRVRNVRTPYVEVEVKMLSITETKRVPREKRENMRITVKEWIQNDRDVQAVQHKLRMI